MQLRYCSFTASFVLALIFLASLSLTAAKTVLTSVTGSGFGPASQSANVGDVIAISFTVGSATFTQSTFEDPCTPLGGGKDSGLKTIASGAGPQDFRFTLDTSNPLYFFNAVSGQCQKGFVFALNASPQQFAQFKSNAAGAGSKSNAKLPDPVVIQPTRVQSNSPNVVTVAPSQRPVSTPSAISTPTSVPVVTRPLNDTNPTISSTSPSITGNTDDTETRSSAGSLGIISHSGDPFSNSAPISPTNPSTPSTTESPPITQNSGSSSKKSIVATVVGILLGLLALIAIAVVVTARRLRRCTALLPTGTDLAANSQSASGKQFIPGASTLFKRAFKPRGWNRLSGLEERQITPFFPEQRTAEMDDVDNHIVTRPDSLAASGRHLSQSTLVDSRWREETHHSRSGSASSLVVEMSETEKSVTIHRGRVLIDNRTSPIPRASKSSNLDVGESPV